MQWWGGRLNRQAPERNIRAEGTIVFLSEWAFLEQKEEYNEKRRKIYRHSSQISNKLFGKVIIIIYRGDKLLTLAAKATTMSVETGESVQDAPNGQSRR
ncbi:hypothetical protein [Allofournierella sp.]|uniref:hypothetical protein n=1 Tax=Allofournierella sp. TaxID=1940256 RepID=UPI003AB1CD0A